MSQSMEKNLEDVQNYVKQLQNSDITNIEKVQRPKLIKLKNIR